MPNTSRKSARPSLAALKRRAYDLVRQQSALRHEQRALLLDGVRALLTPEFINETVPPETSLRDVLADIVSTANARNPQGLRDLHGRLVDAIKAVLDECGRLDVPCLRVLNLLRDCLTVSDLKPHKPDRSGR
jgi:hypothetical protein